MNKITPPQNKTLLGLGQMVTAAAFYGSMGLWSVLMAGAFGAFSASGVRSLVVLTIMGIIGISTKQFRRPEKRDLKWFGLLALSALNVIPYFIGFQLLGAGMGTVIFNVAMAIGGFLFARILFREKITLLKIISLIVALSGVVIIYGFSVNQNVLWGSLAMLLSGALASIISAANKKLIKYSQTQQVFTAFLVIFVVSLPLSFIFGDQIPEFSGANFVPWLALFIYAGVNIGSMYFRISSLKYLEVNVVVLVGLTEIVFGVLFGALFLNEAFSAQSAIGVFVIILGLALETTILLFAKKRKI